MKTKEELLKHYSTKNPRHLKQYDIFTDPKTWDSVVRPNSVWICETDELMDSPWTMRLLFDPKLSQEEILRALKKIKAALSNEYV